MKRDRRGWMSGLKMTKDHLRDAAVTGGTGGVETGVEVASRLLPWAQAAPVEASLSGGLGTWPMTRFLFKFELGVMDIMSNNGETFWRTIKIVYMHSKDVTVLSISRYCVSMSLGTFDGFKR